MAVLCDKIECTGCMACYNICSLHSIDIVVDEKGFKYPQIDISKCISCGLCEKVCPVICKNQNNVEKQQVFACWSKDKNNRKDSSSGGMFYEIALSVINSGGYVCGAAFDGDFNVQHIVINDVSELKKIQGSKYVQSDTSSIYKPVENLLKSGKMVLCSGTPCQIDGIISYLNIKGVDCEKLYTCDLICHGIPSPRMWNDYKQSLQKKYKSRLKKYNFRYKKPGWMVFSAYALFENGKEYLMSTNKDKYLRAFLYDYIIRENCQNCNYTNTNRVADITLADFWGYKNEGKYINDDKGISLAIVNTNKGNQLFELTKTKIVYLEKTLEEAVAGNRSLSAPWPQNKKTEQFWEDYFKKGYKYVEKRYLIPLKPKVNFKNRIRNLAYRIKILPNVLLLRLIGCTNYDRLKRIFKR